MSDYEFDENGLPRRLSAEERRAKLEAENARRIEAAEAKKKVSRTKKPVGERKPRRAKKASQVIVNDATSGLTIALHHETLPNGGTLTLMNPDELTYFKDLRQSYSEDYAHLLRRANDRNRLSQLISFELMAYRYGQRMMGSVTKYDDQGNVAGVELVDPIEIDAIAQALPKVQEEIRKLEVALKIDKKTRDGDGQGEVRKYMETLKKAAIDYKIHLSERYVKYDEFVNECKWRLRVLKNADDEDRKYHGIPDAESVVEWMEGELAQLTELDKQFGKDKQSLWVGQI